MGQRPRIGILGGTFDPPHNAHLQIARAARDAARLDRVLFVVAARPPHKIDDTVASPADRLEMVRSALADDPGMEACDIELNWDGPSYTVRTLEELGRSYADAEFYLILGQDSLKDFPMWKDPDGILRRARLLAAARPGEADHLPQSLKGRYETLPIVPQDISSTEIRRRLATGQSIDGMVPDVVARIIERKKLYHGKHRSSQSG